MSVNEMLMAAAGQAGGAATYVEDVFSTYLYTGNGSSQTITNGIDLAGKGGLTWIKRRDSAVNHYLATTVGGTSNYLNSNTTSDYETGVTTRITSFNADGFSIGSAGSVNNNGSTFCSWTFREQAKFFDVVTYTGTGSARTIAHNLGSTPGMIIVKCTSAAGLPWRVYHRSLPSSDYLSLNTTDAKATASTIWNSTDPTSTVFSVGTAGSVNGNGDSYIAYLFAHDAGGFGAAGTDNVISCGSFTADGSGNATVNLGFEPQFVMLKSTNNADDWFMFDTMRGMVYGTLVTTNDDAILKANTTDAETIDGRIRPTATGFDWNWINNTNMIYMAIRRPMKPPTSGADVFVTDAAGANASANGEVFSSTFPVDFHFRKERSSAGNNWFTNSRLIPGSSLRLNLTNAESTLAYVDKYDRMSGIATTTGFNYTDWAGWLFKRATGFFDMVCYTGTGSATTVTHNLGVVPELILIKQRDAAGESWQVYSANIGNTKYLSLNTDSAQVTSSTRWNNTTPTSSVFTVGTGTGVNGSGNTYVAHLFATLDGVSKVGSYTGNGSNQTINCGFSAGARFVLIKRTDSTGDWYVFDTARGIVSGNDPFLWVNTTAAEDGNYDAVDPANSGFIVNNDATNFPINVNNATYIFLAIA